MLAKNEQKYTDVVEIMDAYENLIAEIFISAGKPAHGISLYMHVQIKVHTSKKKNIDSNMAMYFMYIHHGYNKYIMAYITIYI